MFLQIICLNIEYIDRGERIPYCHNMTHISIQVSQYDYDMIHIICAIWGSGLGSIPFFQFNSNSNSVIFNSNSNSNSTTHKKFQFQFQFQFQRFQFQFQFRRFQIPAISIEFWKWPLVPSLKLIIIILTRYMYIKLLLLIPSVSYPLLNGYNYMASWLMLYQ